MRGLPKSYAKMGFVEGWKAYKASKVKRKLNKRRTTKRKVVGVKRLVRRRRYSKKRTRRQAKIPLEVAIAGLSIPFTGAASGFASPVECVQKQDFTGLADNLKVGFLGFKPARNASEFDLFRALNPFDMQVGRYYKMLIVAGLISKLRKRLVRIPFKKVPLIGRYIS